MLHLWRSTILLVLASGLMAANCSPQRESKQDAALGHIPTIEVDHSNLDMNDEAVGLDNDEL